MRRKLKMRKILIALLLVGSMVGAIPASAATVDYVTNVSHWCAPAYTSGGLYRAYATGTNQHRSLLAYLMVAIKSENEDGWNWGDKVFNTTAQTLKAESRHTRGIHTNPQSKTEDN